MAKALDTIGEADSTRLFSAPRAAEPATLPERSAGKWSPVGQMVGGYKLVRPLGSGGMGLVFLAEHPIIGSRAAIKVLRPDLAKKDHIVRYFVDEARAAARLTHPNSVRIYDLTVLPTGEPCIVMEFVDGDTLAARLARSLLPFSQTVSILTQLCQVVGAAHKRGIVHRDIKPANIMLPQDENGVEIVKLLDFGLAKLDGVDLSAAGTIMGTLQYMSPEQIQGQRVDGRTDVFALAVLACEMLTGQNPFAAVSQNELMEKHLHAEPDLPTELTPALRSVLLKALAKRADDRYADGSAFGVAFADACQAIDTVRSTPPPASPAPELPLSRETDLFLREFGADLDERLGTNHYGFLGLPPDAPDDAILASSRRLDIALTEVGPLVKPTYQDRLRAIAERLTEVRRTLLNPQRRVWYDAEISNIKGIQAALRSGVQPNQLLTLQKDFEQRYPDRAARARALAGEADEHIRRGEWSAALARLDEALHEDPLSVAIIRRREGVVDAILSQTDTPSRPLFLRPSSNKPRT